MKNDNFEELIASIEEAGKIHRGEKKASRTQEFSEPNIKAIRDKANIFFEVLRGTLIVLRGTPMDTHLRELPIAERIQLVEDLWDSIAADQNASRLRLSNERNLIGTSMRTRLMAIEVD